MRIAIIAPLFETVPPQKYGGTERVVHYIVEELVNLGHTVTLYASRGTKSSAHLVECCPATLRQLGIGTTGEATRDHYVAQLMRAFDGTETHDIVHVHHGTYFYHPAILETMRHVPVIWTDHNAIHNDGKPEIFKALAKLNIGITALSDSHKNTAPDANWAAIIHHGLPATLLTPSCMPPTYLAFLGRIAPEKGILTAVKISEAAGFQLKVAAKVDAINLAYYESEVKPLFDISNVDFIGEISDKEKGPFLSASIALIFPIHWSEPFGLVMIEAMACGCPVIAFRKGSVPEVVEHGLTGFVVDNEEAAVEALQHIGELDRGLIRRRFEERWTSKTMAKKYLDVYARAICMADTLNVAKDLAKASHSGNVAEWDEPNICFDSEEPRVLGVISATKLDSSLLRTNLNKPTTTVQKKPLSPLMSNHP